MQSVLNLLIAILPIAATALLGERATFPNLKPWYEGLRKPSFNPPNWLFGPVWTILYALMAIAVWRILQAPADAPSRSPALALFFVQLALNAAWSWLFFAWRSPFAGLLDIVPQWLSIISTIILFSRIDALAALCLAPLAVWAGFAALLNFSIWRLNG